MTPETLQWHAVSEQLPDDEVTVLVYAPEPDEPVWPGWYASGVWFTAEGAEYEEGAVIAWAHLPKGPPT